MELWAKPVLLSVLIFHLLFHYIMHHTHTHRGKGVDSHLPPCLSLWMKSDVTWCPFLLSHLTGPTPMCFKWFFVRCFLLLTLNPGAFSLLRIIPCLQLSVEAFCCFPFTVADRFSPKVTLWHFPRIWQLQVSLAHHSTFYLGLRKSSACSWESVVLKSA